MSKTIEFIKETLLEGINKTVQPGKVLTLSDELAAKLLADGNAVTAKDPVEALVEVLNTPKKKRITKN